MEYDNNLKGSRTPFIDYRTGENVYNQRGGFTPSQNKNNYGEIPSRPPSRPFGDISFKGQNNNNNNMVGGRNYPNGNYSNSNNYY